MCRTFAILIIITFATQVFFGNCFAFFCLFAGFVDDIPLVSGWIHSSFFFPLFSPYALDMWYLSCICRVVFGSYFCHTASCWKTDATANTSEQMEESWSEKILWQRSKKKMKKKYCFKRKIKNVWAQPCEFYDGFASNERNIDIRCTSLIRLWNIFRYIFCSPHKLYIIHIVNMCDCRLHCLKAQFIIRLQCPPAKHFHRQHVWSGFHSLNYLLLWPFETAQVTLPLHIHESSVNVMNDIALLVSLLMILMLFCFLLSHKFFSSFCYI